MFLVQWSVNDGKCGVCGDAYDQAQPRRHEAGGEYGRGIISRHYFAGQVRSIETITSVLLLPTRINEGHNPIAIVAMVLITFVAI